MLQLVTVTTSVETLGDLNEARAEAERYLGTPPTRVFLPAELARRLTRSSEWPDELLGLKVVGGSRLAFDAVPLAAPLPARRH